MKQNQDPKVNAHEKMVVRDHSTFFRQWQKDVVENDQKRHLLVSPCKKEEGALPF